MSDNKTVPSAEELIEIIRQKYAYEQAKMIVQRFIERNKDYISKIK